jgi:hypothetical protein
MRTFPKRSATKRTSLEFIERLCNRRWQKAQDALPWCWLEQRIASDATLEWQHGIEKVEVSQNFDQLLARMHSPNIVRTGYLRISKQFPVFAQKDASFGHRKANEFVVAKIISVKRVEAEHPQIVRKLSQMNIKNKSRFPEGFGSYSRECAYVE